MKKTLALFIFILYAFSFQDLIAQSVVVEDVTGFADKYFQAITDANDQVTGYVLFYRHGKYHKGMKQYQFNIYDNELTLLYENELEISRHSPIVSINSSGTTVLFRYYDFDSNTVKNEIYDLKGKLRDESLREIGTYSERNSFAIANSKNYSLISPTRNKGYIQYGTGKRLGENILNFYSESLDHSSWNHKINETNNALARNVCQVDNMVISFVNTWDSYINAQDLGIHLLAIDLDTGKKKFEIDLKANKLNMQITAGKFDSVKNNLIFFGHDYELESTSKYSRGLRKLTVSLEGEIVDSELLTWETDFQYKDSEGKGIRNIHIHEVRSGANGNLLLIGEQLNLDKWTALNRETSYKMTNIMIIELDSDFKVQSVKGIPTSTTFYSQKGMSNVSAFAVGMKIAEYDLFKFQYVQPNMKNDGFRLVYLDPDPKLLGKRKFRYGLASFLDGKYKAKIFEIEAKNKNHYIEKAKDDHIAIAEYNYKKDRLLISLKKLSF